MAIETLTQSYEIFTIGRLHFRSVQFFLDCYEGLVTWEWERKRYTSRLTLALNSEDAWNLRDDLIELFEK